MQLAESFQPQIEPTSDFDIVICILWSRLGTPLTGPDVESNQNSSATFPLVSAMSGVGKSSLIRAGVLPLLLKDGVIEGVNLWRHAVFRPSDAVGDLLDGLAQVLVKPETLPEQAGEGVSAGDLAAQLRKYPTGLDIPIAQAPFHVADLAMKDKDGRRILTASNDHTAQVWDRETGRPLIEALKLANMLTEARFSPDGALIITACIDGTARIWDAETGQPLTERFQHEDRMLAAEFSPDNRRIVTASTDKTARVWDFAPRPSKTHVWLPELVEVICRGTLTENGSFKGAEKAPADMINQIRQELSTDPVQDDWVQWTRWFLADPAERTISPFSQITVSNYIEQKINENTDTSLRVAEQLSFGNPQLNKRIEDALSALHQNKQP